ncbi:Uncharacterised protein [Achromobacter dolens]|nr:hypothetical protein LMG26840_03860 [Achromobacter dolens]CUJ70318.1 Uncharacterised protein [Achromobacter dolens]
MVGETLFCHFLDEKCQTLEARRSYTGQAPA